MSKIGQIFQFLCVIMISIPTIQAYLASPKFICYPKNPCHVGYVEGVVGCGTNHVLLLL